MRRLLKTPVLTLSISVALVLAGSGAVLDAPPARAETTVDSERLMWAPPPLQNPVTLRLGTGYTSNTLDDSKDYIIRLPDSVKTGATILTGGRNIVMIGGHIRIPSYAGNHARARAIYIKNNKGTVHIEGIFVDAVADGQGDAVAIDAPESIVQVQNSRFENIIGAYDEFHGDLIQPWGGVEALRVDKLTGSSNYQGLFIPTDLRPVGRVTLRRTNVTALPEWYPGSKGGYMTWINRGPVYDFAEVYVQPRAGRSLGKTVWPDVEHVTDPVVIENGFAHWPTMPDVTGGVHEGAPPGGDFVPAGVAGLGYVSPGYDSEPPATPTGVAGTSPFSTEATLTWGATSDEFGVAGYRVFRDGIEVADQTETEFLDADLTPGTSYDYTVRAYDHAGNVSAESIPVTVTTLPTDRRPPTPPTRVTADSANTSQVTLSWRTSADDVGVVGYEVRRDGAEIARLTGTTHTDSGLPAGSDHRYEVRAFDRTGNYSRPSRQVAQRTRATGPSLPFRQDLVDSAAGEEPAAFAPNGIPSPPSRRGATALYYLALAATHDPAHRSSSSVTVADRAVEHIRHLIAGGNEPGCSGGADSSAATLVVNALTVAATVPAIWDALTLAEKDAITLLVQACLVASHYVYDDDRAVTTAIDQVSAVDKNGLPSDVEGGIGMGLAAAAFLGADEAAAFLAGFDAEAFLARLEGAGLTNVRWVFGQPSAAELEAATNDEFTYLENGLDEPWAWLRERADRAYSEPVGYVGAAGRGHLAAGAAELPNVCEPGMAVELDGRDTQGVRSDIYRAGLGWAASLANLALVQRLGEIPGDAASTRALRRYTVGTTDLLYKAEHVYRSWSSAGYRGEYGEQRLHDELGFQWLADIAATVPAVSEPGPTEPGCVPNAALGAAVDVSSALRADTGGGHVADGRYSEDSRWVSAEGDATPTITVDLGRTVDIRSIEINSGYNWPYVQADGVLVDFTVEVHTPAGWQEVARYSANTAPVVTTGTPGVRGDQVRLVITKPSRHVTDVARIYEIAVNGA